MEIRQNTREFKKFRIAFVMSSFPTLSETFIYNQIAYLLQQGHDIHLFAYNKSREKVIHQVIKENRLLEMCTYFPTGVLRKAERYILHTLKKILSTTNFLKHQQQSQIEWNKIISIYSKLKAEKWFENYLPFDIIHVHHGIVAMPIAHMLAKGQYPNTSLVVTFHGYDLDPSHLVSYQTLYTEMFETASALTVNTPYLKEILLSVCNQPQKIYELPVSLDTRKFNIPASKTKRLPEEPFRIIYCGRMIGWKGPDLAVRIINEVINKYYINNVILDMIGTGPLFSAVSSLVKQNRLDNNIILHGSLSQENLIQIMQKGHLFLLPGIYDPKTGRAETQGLVIQEAQAMGLPVMVSDAGGMQYGMVNGETGFVIEAGNIQAFAARIAYLYNHEDERQAMSLAARAFVSAHYDIEYLGNKLESIYQQIIADQPNLSNNISGSKV